MNNSSPQSPHLKKCFVISPIGDEGSETRKHADIVFECIIEPACEDKFEMGGGIYEPQRGDHKTTPGKITDQIYEDILEAELIIAVLTEQNPNVYYELAVAQSAAKPVILLLKKGFTPPFDVKDHRIIYYDFDPQNIYRDAYGQQLRDAIISLENRRTRPVVPFAPYLAPLGDPMQKIGDRMSEAEEDVIRIVKRASNFLWMMGYTLNGWLMNGEFIETLSKRHGIQDTVRVLLMDEENPTLEPSMKTNDVATSTLKTAATTPSSWDKILQKADVTGEVRINKAHSMGYQVLINESEAIAVPYLVSRDTVRGPYVFAKTQSVYYDTMYEEFEFLWSKSAPFNEGKSAKKAKGKKNS